VGYWNRNNVKKPKSYRMSVHTLERIAEIKELEQKRTIYKVSDSDIIDWAVRDYYDKQKRKEEEVL
jgi:hypothetical protein